MKPSRSLQRILVIGETHFVGKALVMDLLKNNPQLEVWVNASISTIDDTRLHVLSNVDQQNLLNAWQVHRWEAVLHLVSKYTENSVAYKVQLRSQKSVLGSILQQLTVKTDLKPLYVEIETDWVYNGGEAIEEVLDETAIAYLENYPQKINIETTNILAGDMQPNHWIFHLIQALESDACYGVPKEAQVLRDWIAKEDYVEAIQNILKKGVLGKQYNVVGFNEWTNYDLMLLIGATFDRVRKRENGVFKVNMRNEKVPCRRSYKQTKIGVCYLEIQKNHQPQCMYELVEQFVSRCTPLVTQT